MITALCERLYEAMDWEDSARTISIAGDRSRSGTAKTEGMFERNEPMAQSECSAGSAARFRSWQGKGLDTGS